VAVFLTLVLCVSSCGLLWAAQLWLPASGLPFGYQVEICAGVNTVDRPQVGIAWISPFMSSLPGPVFFWPARICGHIPWLPFFPPRGGFVFPP
jgi:hypothetical protein